MGTTSSFMDYGGYEKDAASTKHAHTLAPTQVLSPTHIAPIACLAPIACVPYSPSRDSLLPHSLSISSHTNSHTSPSHVIPSLPSTCGAPFPPSTPVLRPLSAPSFCANPVPVLFCAPFPCVLPPPLPPLPPPLPPLHVHTNGHTNGHRGEHRVLDVDFLLERYKWFDSDLSRLSRRDKVRMVQSKRSSKERQPYARKRRPTYRIKLHLQSKETAVRP